MSCSDKTSKCSNECTAPCSQRLTGMVKWFNNKSGFGFITVSGTGEFGGKDIFVHYSSIRVTNSQYKYLVQGEYVEFTLSNIEGGKHEFQAAEVCGIKGGKLMCETRHELKSVRTTYRTVNSDEGEVARQPEFRSPRAVRPPRNEIPRQSTEPTRKPYKARETTKTDGEWTHAKKRAPRDTESKK